MSPSERKPDIAAETKAKRARASRSDLASTKVADAPSRSARKASGRKAIPKSHNTRLHILRAAAEIFAVKGYSLTRLGDIADGVGLHLTALYYHYDNKEALASDLLIHTAQRNLEALREAVAEMSEDNAWRSRIEAAVRTHLDIILRQDPFMRAYRAIVAQVSPEVRETSLKITREAGAIWAGLLDGARNAGEIREDLDLTMARMSLLGSMNWAIEWFVTDQGDVSILADTIVTMTFDGLSKKNQIGPS